MRKDILLILVVCKVADGSIDPCSSYTTIDEWKRSVRYNKASEPLCDSVLQEGWYRAISKAGENMPTTCLMNGFRCGTIEPIWLNGTLPNAGQTKHVTACSSHFNGDCCKTSYTIEVKNCTGYYVYKLVPTLSCPQAYCFGQELPCPSGQTSITGFSPGCKYEPCLSVNHKPLDKWQRSFGNNITDNTAILCDTLLQPGWYRPESKAGNSMPTTCPVNGFRCGTIEPIWLSGIPPKLTNQSVNATACVSSVQRGCCSPSYDIEIRNCGAFNIYKLVNTNACPQAYCFGTEIPCPVGWTSDTGYTPGCEFDPCYTSNYKILKGQDKRTSNYTLKRDEAPIDDSKLQTSWYTVISDTGNDIAIVEQTVNRCGTMYPMWMNGSLPAIAEKVAERKVCMSDTHNFCQFEINIKVKHCGTFYVYLLAQAPKKNSGYCFGDKPYKIDAHDSAASDSMDLPWIVVVCFVVTCLLVIVVVLVIRKKGCKSVLVTPKIKDTASSNTLQNRQR